MAELSITGFFRKHTFITGTLLLTMTGFFTRVLGFFYRIFLSRTIGAEGLGLYNMVHPVYGICFALCAGSVQTAVSQFVASNLPRGKAVFRTGLAISLTMAVALSWLLCRYAGFISTHVLMEERCAGLLPYMAISVPFSAIHACVNGYYYGIQKTRVPAFSQVVEQLVRMAAVFSIAYLLMGSGREITVELAVLGHLIGEIASCAYTAIAFSLHKSPTRSAPSSLYGDFREIASPLLVLALPLMGNRLVLNLLTSAEAIWIPSRLQMSGLTPEEAFSVYGVLTGMSLPFILFPSAITNSIAVLLLPTVAQAQAEGKNGRIAATISMSLRYSLYMGILFIGVFVLFGNQLGTSVFHDVRAGEFIVILSWLCPFMYLATTLGSILNGLGRTQTTFLQNTIALITRLGFVLFGIPALGITAYLWGMLLSELLLAGMHLFSLKRRIPFTWDAWRMIVKPAMLLMVSIGIYYALLPALFWLDAWPVFLRTTAYIAILCSVYLGLLLLFHPWSAKREAR